MSFDEILSFCSYYDSVRKRSLYIDSQAGSIAKEESLICEIKGYPDIISKIKSNLITKKIHVVQEQQKLEAEYAKIIIIKNLDQDKKEILFKFYNTLNHIYTLPDIYERIILNHWKKMIEDKDILELINDGENSEEIKKLLCSHILERYSCQ